MSWTNIDDRIMQHPKMKRAMKLMGDAAWCLWSRGLVYTNAYDLDGRVPRDIVDELTTHPKPFDVADALVSVGLWQSREDGDYQVHDYAEHNETRSVKDARRKASKARLKKHRDKRAGIEDETESKQVHIADGNADETRFKHVAVADQERVSFCVIPTVPDPYLPEPSQATPAAATAGLSATEVEVFEALASWPALAPLASVDMVRQIRATASPAGWSPDDVLAGIADLGEKQGLATAASGSLDAGKLATKLSGFIKSACLRRRSGGPDSNGGQGGQGSASKAPPCPAPGPPSGKETSDRLAAERAVIAAPDDDPNRLAFFAALQRVGT